MSAIAFSDLPLAIQLIIAGVILLFAVLAVLPTFLSAQTEQETTHPPLVAAPPHAARSAAEGHTLLRQG